MLEIVLGEEVFRELLDGCGFILSKSYPGIPHPYLEELLGNVRVMTYLCEAR